MSDLISREAAIEALKYNFSDADNISDVVYWSREQVLTVLNNQPTIDPVKHGRWIHDGKRFEGGNDWWHCSKCGYTDVLNRHNPPKYCPNCGARMDEVTE